MSDPKDPNAENSARDTRPGDPVGAARRTKRGSAANAALLALARASRSILIYQPRSDSVRQVLSDYKTRMREALEGGDIELEVRPFELVLAGEIVYLDRDRDRSLAFFLFRDGKIGRAHV